MAEQAPVDFGWADTLPITVLGERYELDLDMGSSTHAKIVRWWAQLADLGDDVADAQSIDYLDGRVKGVSRETIATWHPMIRKQLLAFLSNGIADPTPAAKPPTSTT